jgi:hypothetical protein
MPDLMSMTVVNCFKFRHFSGIQTGSPSKTLRIAGLEQLVLEMAGSRIAGLQFAPSIFN